MVFKLNILSLMISSFICVAFQFPQLDECYSCFDNTVIRICFQSICWLWDRRTGVHLLVVGQKNGGSSVGCVTEERGFICWLWDRRTGVHLLVVGQKNGGSSCWLWDRRTGVHLLVVGQKNGVSYTG